MARKLIVAGRVGVVAGCDGGVGVANSRTEPEHPAMRAAVLLGVSVGTGALCGGLAAASLMIGPGPDGMSGGAVGMAMGAVLGMIPGAVIGLLIWPAVILTLWRVSLSSAMPIVLVPPVVMAVLGGHVPGAPFYCMLSVPVFVACLVIARLVLRPVARHSPPPGMCAGCGYDRSGLARCPECGRLADAPEAPWRRRADLAVGVALLGVAGPIAIILLAMVEHFLAVL